MAANGDGKRTGYRKGRKLSEEHKRKIARASRGRIHTEETKQKIREAQKGKKLSEETKKKIGDFWRGKKRVYSEEHRRKSRELRMQYNRSWAGKYHNKETKRKISQAHQGMKKPWVVHPDNKGEKNPNWQGGKSFELYGVYWTEALKDSIRRRDNYACRMCGKLQNRISHDVHHIDYDKKNCDSGNLITLCHLCHVKTNKKRNYWIKYFQSNFNDPQRL